MKIRANKIGMHATNISGSRLHISESNAVKMAAEDVLAKLFPIAGNLLACPPDDLLAGDGIIYSANDPTKRIEWAEAARKYFNEHSSNPYQKYL